MNLETRLFAYGTLKRGSPMHGQLCRGVCSVERAQLWGRLYELPSGCPALILPEAARLAEASLAAAEDHARLEAALHAPATAFSRDGWRPVVGQLITLADYRTAWPTLDAWEDASPDRPLLFRRTLVRVERDNGLPITAWAYVVPRLPDGSRELMNGEWPVPAATLANE
ncbi:MAG TPA: gamma-glutamylcyclotransferase family protein [Opitutaceae bacterium]|nr:gamma-glutamylcyclotransferase family protein [Opitutaceae bacterium]